MENVNIPVFIKTEKIFGKVKINISLILPLFFIPYTFPYLIVHEVIMGINQLKGVYFPKVSNFDPSALWERGCKVREFVEPVTRSL